jgi:hypothetical protein
MPAALKGITSIKIISKDVNRLHQRRESVENIRNLLWVERQKLVNLLYWHKASSF